MNSHACGRYGSSSLAAAQWNLHRGDTLRDNKESGLQLWWLLAHRSVADKSWKIVSRQASGPTDRGRILTLIADAFPAIRGRDAVSVVVAKLGNIVAVTVRHAHETIASVAIVASAFVV